MSCAFSDSQHKNNTAAVSTEWEKELCFFTFVIRSCSFYLRLNKLVSGTIYDSDVLILAVSTPLLLKRSFKYASCFLAFTINSVRTFAFDVFTHFISPLSVSLNLTRPMLGSSCSRLS